MHIWYILYISILDMQIDWCAAFGDSDDDDDERSDDPNQSETSNKTMLSHSLRKEASALLCEAIQGDV